MVNADWTRDEVEATVADYFAMLELELSAEPYSKADHNRALQVRIGRSKGSIEFKHQRHLPSFTERSAPHRGVPRIAQSDGSEPR